MYKQSLIKIIIMENKVEYIIIKQITAKENRKQITKIVLSGAAFAALTIASMYGFLYFMLWANEITDKILGL